MTTSSVYDTSVEQEVYVFPAALAQQRLWFLDQLEPNSAAYNIPWTIRISVPLNVEVLAQSLQAIVQRHEVLRTTFVMRDEQLLQVVSPTLTVPLSVTDLRNIPEIEREAEMRWLATAEVQQPFDLAHGSLLRTTLFQLDTQKYVLLLTIHHIISDGWSIGLFFRELVTLYETFAIGRPNTLPELSIQYADFALWQREWLQGEVLADQVAYWKQHLAGAPAVLELPTDRPRPTVPTHHGSIQPFVLSRHVSEGLKALSRQEGVTLYMTLVAALQTLLHRYTGQDDILLGTGTAGRTQAEMEELIGFFINTLVLRTDLSGNPTFRELVGRVREVILGAQAHQDVPFEYLVKELQPDRSSGQNPFFQVLLTLDPPFPELSEGWNLHHMGLKTGNAKFDLSLYLADQPGYFTGHFEYSTDLFDAATIKRMVGHWQTLLEGIVAHPEQHLWEFPILTEAERDQVLLDWNATQTAYPREQGIHQLFEQQVERTPTAVALLFKDQQMSYHELNKRANQVAHRLQQLGVGPDVRVGLCLDRSLEMVVGLLGILKAGGAYVPLDPVYPQERLAFMLEDTQAPVLLTQEQYINVLPTEGMHVLCLDKEWQVIAHESTDNLNSGVTGEHLAYVMYTSGSTGKPKGVEIRHRSISRLLFGVDYACLDATRTLLHMAPISFDASTFELWGALLHGARCVLFPERIPTPKGIGDAVRKHKVTTVWLTASLFNALLDDAPEELQGIEQLLTGGEALSVVHIRRALQQLPDTQLINGYGPTESTTFTCCHPIPKQISELTRSIPIGRPIGNTQVYILDRHLNPVPIGVPGELYIGGAGLARGYHNRPALTADKFIAHPWSSEPDARLYKTGDLVRYLADGTIEFLGRLDNQIKLRGFRVELGEIEAMLGQHSAVREAVILARQHERGEKYLVAYVVLQQEQHVTSQELRHFLEVHLPMYMVPSNFVLLDAMPLTANGKVDHRALPIPEWDKRTAEDSYVAPVLAVQQQLVEIWQDVLNVHPIGITDNFFDLGGHSLLAARIVDRIQQTFGKKLPLATFFAGATIERLAVAVQEEHQATTSRASVVTVQASGSRRPFFFLHGDWAGGGFYCRDLSHYLGSDQPFYILEPYKFHDLPVPPSFEEMAAAHIESLQTVQPAGPYLLGGFCNGGLMAYEIARQLQAQGQRVDLLALIDPATPGQHKVVRDFICRFGNVVRLSEEKQVNVFLRYIYLRIPAYRNKVKNRTLSGLAEQIELERTSEKSGSLLAQLKAFFPKARALRYQWSGIYRWVAAGYKELSPYPGKITLLWSSEMFSYCGEWRQVAEAEGVAVHVFPGTHMSCKTDNLQLVAQGLRTCLNDACTEPGIR